MAKRKNHEVCPRKFHTYEICKKCKSKKCGNSYWWSPDRKLSDHRRNNTKLMCKWENKMISFRFSKQTILLQRTTKLIPDLDFNKTYIGLVRSGPLPNGIPYKWDFIIIKKDIRIATFEILQNTVKELPQLEATLWKIEMN